MSRRNHQIMLDEASPGMVLSDDLLDTQGNILLPAGSTLSDSNIASLQRRDVDMLPILGEEASDTDEAVALKRHRQRLARLFRKHTEDDMATEILLLFIRNFRLGDQS